MESRYLQYGCGLCAPVGWLNFDASPTLRFERLPLLGRLHTRNTARFPENVRYGDITRGLPVTGESFRGVYCSHVLEHLAKDDCERALANTFKYLETGGIFRLVVPDLEGLVRAYAASSDAGAAHAFMEHSGLGERCRVRGPRGWLRAAFGKSAHRWLWDEKSMREVLVRTGFREVRRCQFGDCEDVRFQEVEDPQRFEGALAMEARK